MSRSAAAMVLLPRLAAFAEAYPKVVLDVVTGTGPADLVAGEFDAGIQLGEYIQKDMIAVRVTPELRLAVVGSPAYFASRSVPQTPKDLHDHRCITLRHTGGPYRWEFEKEGKSVTIAPDGPLVIDETHLAIQAALSGVGIGVAYEEQVAEHIAKGRLLRVLEDWTPPIPVSPCTIPAGAISPQRLLRSSTRCGCRFFGMPCQWSRQNRDKAWGRVILLPLHRNVSPVPPSEGR
jgi:DNA-binding transcriptional LysR family regulator